MSNSRWVWFQLYNSGSGLPFKGSTATRVSVSTTAIVDDFRDAVKAKYADQPKFLKDIPSSIFLVYKDKSSFDNRNLEDGQELPLKSSCSLDGLGQTEALVVAVPPDTLGVTRHDRTATLATSGTETTPKVYFLSDESIAMTPPALYDWLHSPNTSSWADLDKADVSSQDRDQVKFGKNTKLAGRDDSIQQISDCFVAIHQNRSNLDRMQRPIPICTGTPGLGKTRLLHECSTTVRDRTKLPGGALSGIISYGTDGCPVSDIDEELGISCTFAWRVLHAFFKAHHEFVAWMQSRSPTNRRDLKLSHALQAIEYSWRQKGETSNLLIFVGIDEHQNLKDDQLRSLLDTLAESTRTRSDSLTLLPMLAGTDLNVTNIARLSSAKIKPIPIRYLRLDEAIDAIGPYISKYHPSFVFTEAFARYVFYLGGVPRLLVDFAAHIGRLPLARLTEFELKIIRNETVAHLPDTGLADSAFLKLLAMSFSNRIVDEINSSPFAPSSLLTWRDLIKNGVCMLLANLVVVPFYSISQFVDQYQNYSMEEKEKFSDVETAMIKSLIDLQDNVENGSIHVPAWSSWEVFGAYFYRLRINSFLLCGQSEIRLSMLFEGLRHISPIFHIKVKLKVATVCTANEEYGVNIPHMITCRPESDLTVDWVFDQTMLPIVLNCESGKGVDIFFALERVDGQGYILVVDQRKRTGSTLTSSSVAKLEAKIPDPPTFFAQRGICVTVIFGLMSIFSDSELHHIPESTFVLGSQDSLRFHGSMFDHAGCSMIININTCMKSSLYLILNGSQRQKKDWAEKIIQRREKRKFESFAHVENYLTEIQAHLIENPDALKRIKY